MGLNRIKDARSSRTTLTINKYFLSLSQYSDERIYIQGGQLYRMAKSLSCQEPAREMKLRFITGTEIAGAVRKISRGKTILGIFSGRLYRQDRNGVFHHASGFSLGDYLIATPDQLIFWERGESGQKTESIRYQDITSVEYATGIIFGDVNIGSRAACRKFGDASVRDISRIRCIVTERMDYCRNLSCPSRRTRVHDGRPAPGLFGTGTGIGWIAADPGKKVHS